MGKLDPKHAFFTAEGFRDSAKLIFEARKAGNLLLGVPIVTNSAFALEMYLKCLLFLENGKQHAGHDLYKLFKVFMPKDAAGINRRT